jgi:hypothetical protein
MPARLSGLGATELATCEDADRHQLLLSFKASLLLLQAT